MKNKKLTYGLLIIVTALWGLIFYRLYASLAGDDSYVSSGGTFTQKVAQKPDPVPDNFTLLLDYRDPFLGTLKPAKEPEPEGTFQEATSLDLSFLQYLGVINNPKNNKSVTILSIHGKDHMMEEGMTVEGVKLIKNYKDSIKIALDGVQAFVKR